MQLDQDRTFDLSYRREFDYKILPEDKYYPDNTSKYWMDYVRKYSAIFPSIKPFILTDAEFYQETMVTYDAPPSLDEEKVLKSLRIMNQFGTPQFNDHFAFLVHFDKHYRAASLLNFFVEPLMKIVSLENRYFLNALPQEKHVVPLAESFIRQIDMPGPKSLTLRFQIESFIKDGIDDG